MATPADPSDPHGLRSAALALIGDVPTNPALSGLAQSLQRLSVALVNDLDLDGAAIQVQSGGALGGIAATSGGRAEQLSELEYTLGEGPGIDAVRTSRPVLVGDLEGVGSARWPAYAAALLDSGISAVFAFPLQVGAAGVGVLLLYGHSPGSLGSQASVA